VLATAPGDLDGVAYLQKYTTLEHMQADQVAKLQSDIIYRRLVEVRSSSRWSHFMCNPTFVPCMCIAYSVVFTARRIGVCWQCHKSFAPHVCVCLSTTCCAAQVVVSHSDLVGKCLRAVRFRQTYGAAVLGIHRQGELTMHLPKGMGGSGLHSGSTLSWLP
jgi:hypothetical protein